MKYGISYILQMIIGTNAFLLYWHGILYISHMKILIEIFWHKYLIFYISRYRNQGTDFPWIRHFYTSQIEICEHFHTHVRFFTFNISKSQPRYLYKNKETLCFIYENMSANIPIWNMEFSCIIFEIAPSIFFVSHMNISAQIFLEEVLNIMCIT